jgi:hypothetical protein
MNDETIESCPEYGADYRFLPEADWWKQGVSYETASDRRYTAPTSQTSLEKDFNERADSWEKKTRSYSSPTKRFLHEDYQIIMTMGQDVVPYILKRLQKKPNDWFWALKHFARKDVAAGKDTFEGAVQAWLKWGVDEGHISAE